MGVTVVTAPSELSALGNGIPFKLNISDTGTHPIYKQAIFRLKDSGGTPLISNYSVARPIGGGDMLLNFRDDIRGKVRTKMPVFGPSGTQNDNTILKEFKLEFGERIIDVSVPGGDISTSVADSSNFKVLSAANNVFDSSLITDTTARILSLRPKKYSLFSTSYDWIWLLGNGVASYTFYKGDGTFTTQTQSAPYDVNVIPMNLVSLGAPQDTVYMKVNITADGIDEDYIVDFGTDCSGGQDNSIEVLFIEPLGGRSVALFQILQGVGANLKFNEICINRNISSVADLRQDGGNTMIFKEMNGTFTMQKEMLGDPQEIDWFFGFMASGEYHIRRIDQNNQEYWAKFIVDSGSYNPVDKLFQASGHLALPIKGTLQP